MSDPNFPLVLGSPRFADSTLNSLASKQGVLAAWREAVKSRGAQAACGVTGDFAIGFREPKGSAFLAVDRFAIRTICYRIVDGGLHFANRADELADINTPVDPQAIFDYLYFHVIPSPRTIYKGIFRLPPGNFALFENGQLTVAPYWVPSFEEQKGASFDTLKGEFRQLLQNAVASQLDGSKPACFLSGGTDSSTVAGMATSVSGKTIASYSIGFDAQGYDEMKYARLAAKHFKTDHHEYYITPDDLVRSIPAVAGHYDQPFGNSSALPAYYCAKMAREDGVSKVLAGDGGDELFGGNTRYAKQKVFGWYDTMPVVPRRQLFEPVSKFPLVNKVPLVRKVFSYVNQAKVPMPDRLMTYNLLLRLGVHEILTPELLARVDQDSPAQQQRNVWALARLPRKPNASLRLALYVGGL